MERSIEIAVAVGFLVIGLSHLFQPRVWAQYFIDLREKGEVASFHVAFMHLPLGALIVGFHNVWSGAGLVLTVIGWAYVLKSLVYFVWPRHGLRVLARVSVERAWGFAVVGVLLIGYGAFLLYSALGG
jgi:hypothetical protein